MILDVRIRDMSDDLPGQVIEPFVQGNGSDTRLQSADRLSIR